ncbi:hypothetical protein L9F63_020800, partial [Diploptera punctata]
RTPIQGITCLMFLNSAGNSSVAHLMPCTYGKKAVPKNSQTTIPLEEKGYEV